MFLIRPDWASVYIKRAGKTEQIDGTHLQFVSLCSSLALGKLLPSCQSCFVRLFLGVQSFFGSVERPNVWLFLKSHLLFLLKWTYHAIFE